MSKRVIAWGLFVAAAIGLGAMAVRDRGGIERAGGEAASTVVALHVEGMT